MNIISTFAPVMEENVKQNSLRAWILAARPKTLSGALVPVVISLALAWTDIQEIDASAFSWTAAALCALFAILMEVLLQFNIIVWLNNYAEWIAIGTRLLAAILVLVIYNQNKRSPF